jgi:hypothetical protein
MPERTPRTKPEKAAAVHQVMHEFKEGDLHSGSKDGPKVTSRDQAVAIAMSESGQGRRAPAAGSHGYGHPAPLRSGALRNSGHSGAHRVGKRR